MAERKDNRGLRPGFIAERSVKVIDLADRAETIGNTNARDRAESILTEMIKASLKGRLPEQVLVRIGNVQITTKVQGIEDE